MFRVFQKPFYSKKKSLHYLTVKNKTAQVCAHGPALHPSHCSPRGCGRVPPAGLGDSSPHHLGLGQMSRWAGGPPRPLPVSQAPPLSHLPLASPHSSLTGPLSATRNDGPWSGGTRPAAPRPASAWQQRWEGLRLPRVPMFAFHFHRHCFTGLVPESDQKTWVFLF